ncbi:MAG TPA: TRAFs-binding domain-containing protein [Burkholderiaceae bacterium]|nr:TRAFs-binding domain-containing protein [Burkholderiaceae bacterium]
MGTCFVAQGFGKKTDYTDGRVLDLDASYAVIRDAVKAAGHVCLRADEIVHSGTIDVPMYEQLLGADLVIVDLSTYNVNAAFELGIRYGLRPHATIVVAEEGFKHTFDVDHIVIRRYKHLGEDIGRREAERFQQELKTAIAEIIEAQKTDSPVYTFLPHLQPPQLAAKVLARAAVPSPAAAPADAPDGEEARTSKWLLETALAKMNPPYGQTSDFAGATTLLTLLHAQRPHDPYITQQLALATYKAQHPTPLEALRAAQQLLQELNPVTTNDPETLGLWGAVHKRLWELQAEPADLSESIKAYLRGFYLKQDHYNGVNYAALLETRALHFARSGARDDAVADRVLARRAREDVLRYVTPQIDEQADLALEKRYWLLASLWEVCVGLGRFDEAARREAQARALQPPAWMLQSTEEQLARTRRAQAELAVALAVPDATPGDRHAQPSPAQPQVQVQ